MPICDLANVTDNSQKAIGRSQDRPGQYCDTIAILTRSDYSLANEILAHN